MKNKRESLMDFQDAARSSRGGNYTGEGGTTVTIGVGGLEAKMTVNSGDTSINMDRQVSISSIIAF